MILAARSASSQLMACSSRFVRFFIVAPDLKLAELARGVRDNRHDPVLLPERPRPAQAQLAFATSEMGFRGQVARSNFSSPMSALG
jgi:hypothetical protein